MKERQGGYGISKSRKERWPSKMGKSRKKILGTGNWTLEEKKGGDRGTKERGRKTWHNKGE